MDALALLRLQVEWGADEALDPAPRDRLQSRPAAANAAVAAPVPQPLKAAVPALSIAGINRPGPLPGPARAAAIAAQAMDLEALHAAVADFADCPLQATAIHTVFGAGPATATVMLIGDTPGEAEDRSGEPFAGAQGALLDGMLASIGLARDGLRLAYAIPWRPPGNRRATAHERALCLPFLQRHIALVRPARVMLLGNAAASGLLDAAQLRRRSATAGPIWHGLAIPGLDAPVCALVSASLEHLAANPAAKREAWADLIGLRLALDTDAQTLA